MGKRSKYSPQYDWEKLKTEFIQTTENPNQFRLRHGISQQTFYSRMASGNWIEEREDVHKRGAVKAKDSLVDKIAEEWKREFNILRGLQAQVISTIRTTTDADGRITAPLSPRDIRSLAGAMESILKSLRLLAGQSTDNLATVNYHEAVVKLIQETENERRNIIDIKPIGPTENNLRK